MHTLLSLLSGGPPPASIPNPAPVAPPGVEQAVGVVFGYGKWIAYAVCGLASIVAGARFAIEVRQHGGSGDAARQLLLALVGAGVVSGAVAIVSTAVQ
jgi:hypothetical protein